MRKRPYKKPPGVTTYFADAEDWKKIEQFFTENPHLDKSAVGRAWFLKMIEQARKTGLDYRTLLPRG